MAIVNGTSGSDFIHVGGDGLTPPGGYTDNSGATDLADTIDPGAGDDIVLAGGGNDSITLGANLTASDSIDGGSGSDTVTLNGNYNISFTASTMVNVETITLSAGHDYSLALADETIAAGQTLTVDGSGLAPANHLTLNDHLETDGNLIATGGAGSDSLFFGGGTATLNGGAGDDTLASVGDSFVIGTHFLDGGDGNDQLSGNAGFDTLMGGAGRDIISMGPGTATIDAGVGDDIVGLDRTIIHEGGLKGGKGTDRLDLGEVTLAMSTFSAASSGFEVLDHGGGLFEAHGDDSSNNFDFSGFTLIFFSNVALDGAGGSDVLTGNTSDDLLFGGSGDDVLNGGDGNDDLMGGAGVNVLNGGAGNDRLRYDNDFLATAPESDTMNAGDGDDTIFAGHNGTYVIDGGAGDDIVELEGTLVTAGNLQGGAGIDTLHLSGATLALAVFDAASVGFEMLGPPTNSCQGDDTDNILDFSGFQLLSSGGVTVDGAGGNDTLTGTALNDTISGGADNDFLKGGHGSDMLRGNAGDDTYVVLEAGDVVIENNDDGIDSVRTKLDSYTLTDNVENLRFNGQGSFAGTGNDLANQITGGSGNDTLEGKGGADTLKGDLGADTFKYAAVSDSNRSTCDKIGDFDGVSDTISLWFSVAAFNGMMTSKSLKTLETTLDAAHLGPHEVVFVTVDKGQTYLVVDADGVAGYQTDSDLLIQVKGTNLDQIGLDTFI